MSPEEVLDLAAEGEELNLDYSGGREGRTREVLAYIVVLAFVVLVLGITVVALIQALRTEDPGPALVVLTTSASTLGPLAGGIVGYYYASRSDE